MSRFLSYLDDTAGVQTKVWCLTIPSSGIEIDIEVEFEFTPGEQPQVFGRIENCHPGSPDDIEIISVKGLESGLCCMDLIQRETVPLRYPWPGRTHQTLLAQLEDDMIDVAKSGR